MDIKNTHGSVIFTSAALTVKDTLTEADSKKAYLSGANLRGANLRGANLSGANLYLASLRDADLRWANLIGAFLRGANLTGANLTEANLNGVDLYRADLRGAVIDGKKVSSMGVFTGLYDYTVWAVLYEDGSRWVRMGCLFKSLEEWEKIGIRKSNLSQYPDDGSEACEERVAAFEFAKAAALRMKAVVS